MVSVMACVRLQRSLPEKLLVYQFDGDFSHGMSDSL